jgi:hypothetical protein
LNSLMQRNTHKRQRDNHFIGMQTLL